jgi:hypothetical protein
MTALGLFLILAFMGVAVIVIAKLEREPRNESTAGSVADPRVARMDLRQRSYGKRLRREGKTLLSGKAYVPVLTIALPVKPPKADKVTPIRRVK